MPLRPRPCRGPAADHGRPRRAGHGQLRPADRDRLAGPITVARAGSVTVARAGPIAVACSWTVAIGLEHLLAVLAAKVLPRRLPRLDVGLGEFLAHVGVVVSHAVTVIGVVLPFPAIDVGDVGGPVGHDVDVARPVAVAPERVPNGDGGCKGDAGRERRAGDIAVGRRKIVRRIVGIGPIPVHYGRLIVRNVELGGGGRLDRDVLLLVLGIDRDRLLLGGSELAVGPRARAQPLDRVHDVRLLGQHGVAELLRPIELLAHHVQHARNLDQ